MKNLLLLSNGTVAPGGFLEYALPWIQKHFNTSPQSPKTILFVPYAALTDHDGYADKAAKALEAIGIKIVAAHTFNNPVELLDKVDGVFVGGGNTFQLLDQLQKTGLAAAIKAKAEAGMPFMGASAGTNITAPTIKTTNDMPIVLPQSFDALALVPFQINPHYVDGKFYVEENGKIVPHNGETRAQRIAEFHEVDATPVLGIREGTALLVTGDTIELLGGKPAKLFRQGQAPAEIETVQDLSALMTQQNGKAPAPERPAAATHKPNCGSGANP